MHAYIKVNIYRKENKKGYEKIIVPKAPRVFPP
jgi:hypothetical protein